MQEMGELEVRRPGRRRAAWELVSDALAAWLRRPRARTDGATVGHSADLRTVVYLMVGAEVLVEALMDASMVPPAWRAVHLVWLALLVDGAFAFGAVTRRHPHVVEPSALRLRGGLLDELHVPRALVAGVRRERLSVQGRGVRPVPDRPDAVACTVAGTAELVLDLREPVRVRLADGRTVTARHLHIAADDPVAAHRTLRAALA